MNDHNFQDNKNTNVVGDKIDQISYNNHLKENIAFPTKDLKNDKDTVDFENPPSEVPEIKLQHVSIPTQSHKILEMTLNKLSGVFILYKFDDMLKSSKNHHTRAIVHEWNINSEDDERGDEVLVIQFEKNVKKKKKSWISKDQIMIKSVEELNLCYAYNSKGRLNLYLPLNDEQETYAIHFTKEQKESQIIGNLKIAGMNKGVRIYPKHEKKQYILGMNDFGVQDGLQKNIFQKCTFESGTLGLFDGIGCYQCVSFPDELVWQERIQLIMAVLEWNIHKPQE